MNDREKFAQWATAFYAPQQDQTKASVTNIEDFDAWLGIPKSERIGDVYEYVAWVAWQAGAKAMQERAAVVCDELHEHYSGYKDTALLNGDVELSNAASGEPRACIAIAAAIRSLE
jgi:hypothetical protein